MKKVVKLSYMSIHENDNFRGPEEEPGISLEDRQNINILMKEAPHMVEDIIDQNFAFEIQNGLGKKELVSVSINKDGQIELHMPKDEDLEDNFDISTLKKELKKDIQKWASNNEPPEGWVDQNIPPGKEPPEEEVKEVKEKLPENCDKDNQENKPLDYETYVKMKGHCGHCGGNHPNHECPKVDKEPGLND